MYYILTDKDGDARATGHHATITHAHRYTYSMTHIHYTPIAQRALRPGAAGNRCARVPDVHGSPWRVFHRVVVALGSLVYIWTWQGRPARTVCLYAWESLYPEPRRALSNQALSNTCMLSSPECRTNCESRGRRTHKSLWNGSDTVWPTENSCNERRPTPILIITCTTASRLVN